MPGVGRCRSVRREQLKGIGKEGKKQVVAVAEVVVVY